MRFHVGDRVVHWSHGLGEVVGVEERDLTGEKKTYYVVKIQELSVWVPNDEYLAKRLRAPTGRAAFDQLFAILGGQAHSLPEDRHERKVQLRKKLEGGSAEDTCRVIRDLTSFEKKRPLNLDDQGVLRRAEAALRDEWVYALSVAPADAQAELRRLLGRKDS